MFSRAPPRGFSRGSRGVTKGMSPIVSHTFLFKIFFLRFSGDYPRSFGIFPESLSKFLPRFFPVSVCEISDYFQSFSCVPLQRFFLTSFSSDRFRDFATNTILEFHQSFFWNFPNSSMETPCVIYQDFLPIFLTGFLV